MAETVVHGPMWQFECKTCGYMGDCWDTERPAAEEMQDHKCVDRLPSWAREEMERMRVAGDALAAAYTDAIFEEDGHPEMDKDLTAWKEARRG